MTWRGHARRLDAPGFVRRQDRPLTAAAALLAGCARDCGCRQPAAQASPAVT